MFAPFTTAQAPGLRLTPALLRSRAVRREHHGAYVEACVEPGFATSVAAARLVLPADAVVDGVSALHAAGVDIGGTRPLRFVSTHPHQVRRAGIRVRRVAALPQNDGLAATPTEAFLAAARELDLVELVAAGDWLVRLGEVTPDQLVAASAGRRGQGSAHARRAAELVRERVDSPRETQLRLCLLLAGLPEPDLNPVVSVGGRTVGRVDLWWRRWHVVVEYEGDQHRVDRQQWNVDIRRAEQLASDGCRVVRVTAERMRHPRAVVVAVLSALRSGGYEGPAPRFDEEWHRLFPTAR